MFCLVVSAETLSRSCRGVIKEITGCYATLLELSQVSRLALAASANVSSLLLTLTFPNSFVRSRMFDPGEADGQRWERLRLNAGAVVSCFRSQIMMTVKTNVNIIQQVNYSSSSSSSPCSSSSAAAAAASCKLLH